MIGMLEKNHQKPISFVDSFYGNQDEVVLRSSSEVLHADKLVNRFEIEREAAELIATKSQNLNGYKTPKTYHDDARTALFEALTASGHLSVVTSRTATLAEIHNDMLSILLNAWSDNLPVFEQRRRFQEICEELTIQQIEKQIVDGKLPPETEVSTISDYVIGAVDNQAIALGYRPYNKKGMVRNSHLISHGNGIFRRVSKQVSRSNADASETETFLLKNDLPTRNEQTPDVRVLGVQTILTGKEAIAGVVGVIKRLDKFKGNNVRYGEEVNNNQLSYDELEQESLRREQEAECYIEILAKYTKKLDQQVSNGQISQRQHQELLKAEIYKILQSICTIRPDYAKDCFGQKAVQTYKEASILTAQGDINGATNLIENNAHLENQVTLCGMSLTKQQAKQIGVETDNLALLLKLGLEKFKTKIGKCRVEQCPSPKPTEVGPCDVCMCCQANFDKGMSYNQIIKKYRVAKQLAKKATKKTTKQTLKWFSFRKN